MWSRGKGSDNIKALPIAIVYAQELPKQTAVVNDEEMTETDETLYTVTLPYDKDCSFVYAEDHVVGEVKKEKEIVLAYAKEEQVEISVIPKSGTRIEEILICDQEKNENLFEWRENNSIVFTMPPKDLWMEVKLAIQTQEIMEPETTATEGQLSGGEEENEEESALTTEVQTEPETSAVELPETEESGADAGEESADGEELTEMQTEESSEALSDGMKEELESGAEKDHVPELEETEVLPSYQEETDADGLPKQGSIVQVEAITIPFDTWEFDQYTDFRNIPYDPDSCMIEYISDDILYDVAGLYSSIYRVTDLASGKFWFVLRPVRVSEKTERIESETSAEEQETYAVYVLENNDIIVQMEQESYHPGELVLLSVEGDAGYQVEEVKANLCSEKEGALSAGAEIEVLEAEKEAKTAADTPRGATYTFTMPESDVLVSAATAGKVTDLSLKSAGEEEAVPDKFKLINTGELAFVPSSMSSNPSASSAATQIRKVVFYDDGGNTVTRRAFCIQPNLESPPGGIYGKDEVDILESGTKEKNLAKCLYYMYGGPAWGKEVVYTDGSGSINMKTLMEKKGCSTENHHYAVTHYVLGYFYVGASGDWNANTGTPHVLSSKGEAVIKALAEEIKKLPVPKTELSVSNVNSEYHSEKDMVVSGSITYHAIEENTATISLPTGITLVDETTGKSSAGKVTIAGGTKLHLEAAPGITGKGNYTLTCKYAVDFTAMALKTAGKQDVGFSYYSGDKTLAFSVTWAEVPVKKRIELQKADKDTALTKPVNDRASFEGAEYGIFTDAACTAIVETLKTNAAGYAKSSELLVGTYYVKETKAPVGYLLDETVHTVQMNRTDAVEVYSVRSVEQARKEQIELQKSDKETGLTKPFNSYASFEGAQYTIYADKECKEPIEVMTTDASGLAKSPALIVDTYYIKETKAPTGYLLDETVYTVDMQHTDTIFVYSVQSSEQVIRKPIEVQKADKETGQAQPQNCAVSFTGAEYTIYTDQALSEQVEVLTTDENGYAISSDLPVGTYYVKETKAPTGYLLDETVYTVEVGADAQKVYRITSPEQIIRGSLSVMKFLDDDYDESVLQDRVESGILAGICFVLKHEDESVPEIKIVTDKYGHAVTKEKALVYGDWFLSEDPDTVPEGYEGITDVKITVSEDGAELHYVVSNKQPFAQIKLIKKDAQTGKAVTISGGKFQILDSDQKPVTMPNHLNYAELTDTFSLDENGVIYFTKALEAGSYQIKELEAPSGYLIGENLKFTVTENHNYMDPMVLEFEDEPQMGNIRIKKMDQESGELLGEGFCFEIYAAEDIVDAGGAVRKIEKDGNIVELKKGTLVAEIQTGKDGIAETENLYLGSYLVKENRAGEYYAISRQEYPVTLTADGKVTDVTVEVHVKNERTKAELLKVDAKDTEKGLEGIRFRIYSSEDTSTLGTEYVTDAEGKILFEELKHGCTYFIYESKTLPGYNIDTTVYEFAVDEQGLINGSPSYCLKISNEPNQLEVTKLDSIEEKALPGAALTLKNSEGEVIETWISTEEAHLMKGLTAGTYTLIEERAPKGYATAENMTFTLTDSLQVQQVFMYDAPIKVLISKKEITGEKELPGAKLVVKDRDGNTVEEWISSEEPHMLNLAVGTYTLTELTAPEGYEVAEDITFEVKDTMEVQHVTMYDAPEDETVDLTGKEETKTTTVNPPAPSGGNSTAVSPVQTGDQNTNRYLAAILLMIGSLTALGIGIKEKRKKK